MSYKKITTVIIAAVLTGACSSTRNAEQSATVATSIWQPQPLEINGNDDEWTGNVAFYNAKMKIGYTISSDNANVYILMQATDPQVQQQILRGGLTVLFNSHGVMDEHGAAGISFPTGNLNQKNNPAAAQSSSNLNIALSNVRDYSLFGFTKANSVENFDLDRENPEGIRVAIGLNPSTNALVYEAMVPFTSIFNQSGAVNAPGRNIAVGFVLDEIPSEQGSGGNGSGVSIGGGLGFGSFGSGGGIGLSIGTGALGGGRRGKLKQTKIWKEVVLAKK